MAGKSRKKTLNKKDQNKERMLLTANTGATFPDSGRTLISFLLLAVLVFGVYASAINNEFVWDDRQIIKENRNIRSLGNAGRLLLSEDTFPDLRSYYYRPVTYISFMLDYVFWKGSPRGFHAVNILLHLIFSCLLYLFARDILGSFRAALTAAVIFALHPAASETVNFISGGRNTLLCGVFLMAALISHRRNLRILTLVFLALSAFSKEFGLLFPFMAFLTDRVFPRPGRDKSRDAVTYMLYAAVIVFYLGMRSYVVGGSGINLKPEALFSRLLLIPQIIVTYLKLMVLPYSLTVPYYIKLSSGMNVSVFIYSALLAAVISIGFYLRRAATVAYSSLWLAGFFLPVLNIIPLGETVVAERYMYIALAGFAVLAGAVSEKIRPVYAVSALVILSLAFSAVVINRNPVWKNDYSLFSDGVKKSPLSPFVHNNLGYVLLEQNKFSEALDEFQESIRLKPDYHKSHNNLGNVYKAQNRLDDAVKEYQITLKLRPDYADAHYNLAISYRAQERLDDAINSYKAAIKLMPNHPFAHNNLGNVYKAKGMLEDAVKEYRIALQVNPDNDNAHSNLGNVYKGRDLPDEAIKEYKAAIRLNPGNAIAHNNLGVTYFDKGMLDDAIEEYRAAVRINPDYWAAHNNLGNAHKAKGLKDEAAKEYRIAARLKQ